MAADPKTVGWFAGLRDSTEARGAATLRDIDPTRLLEPGVTDGVTALTTERAPASNANYAALATWAYVKIASLSSPRPGVADTSVGTDRPQRSAVVKR